MTLIMHPPTGELPDEAPTVAVDAVRKWAIRQLLNLTEHHADLPWPSAVSFFGGERPYVHIYLDNDDIDGHAAWVAALGLVEDPDLGFKSEPTISRTASRFGALGLRRVELTTFLYPARGLPEQGPRPTDADLIVAAVRTPDAPELPAEVAVYRSDRDGATVVEVAATGPTRVLLGDEVLFDGDPDDDDEEDDDEPIPFDPGTGPIPGYVAGRCGHRVAESEWRAGFRTCERCPS